MVDVILDDDGLPIVPDLKEGESSSADREELIKQRGIKQRELTAILKKEKANLLAGLNADGTEKEDKTKKKSDTELDRVDLSILRSEGIKDKAEIDLVQSIMKDTGKKIEEVLELKFFKAELKELRDAKAVADATPGDKKRTGASTRDQVDYWISKGELPPADQVDLRREVVNAKIKLEKNKTQFSKNPIT